MRKDLVALMMVVVAAALLGWWLRPGAGSAPQAVTEAQDATPPSAASPNLAGVQLGMTRHEVQRFLGKPTTAHALYKSVYQTKHGPLTILYSAHPEAQRVNTVALSPTAGARVWLAQLQPGPFTLQKPYVTGLFGDRPSTRGEVLIEKDQITLRALAP